MVYFVEAIGGFAAYALGGGIGGDGLRVGLLKGLEFIHQGVVLGV